MSHTWPEFSMPLRKRQTLCVHEELIKDANRHEQCRIRDFLFFSPSMRATQSFKRAGVTASGRGGQVGLEE